MNTAFILLLLIAAAVFVYQWRSRKNKGTKIVRESKQRIEMAATPEEILELKELNRLARLRAYTDEINRRNGRRYE